MSHMSDEALKRDIEKTAWRQSDSFLSALAEGRPVLNIELSRAALDETKRRILENGCTEITVAADTDYFKEISAFLPETKAEKLTVVKNQSLYKELLDAEFFNAVRRSAVCALDLCDAFGFRDDDAEEACCRLLAEKRMTELGFNVANQNLSPLVPEIVGNPVHSLTLQYAESHFNPLTDIISGLPLKSFKTDDFNRLYLKSKGAVLPMTIESVSVFDSTFSHDAAEAMGAELAKRPHFSELLLESAAVPCISSLIETLGKTTARRLVLPDLDCAPETVEALMKAMETRGCALTELSGAKDLPLKQRENLDDLLRLHAKGGEARAAMRALKNERLDGLLAEKGTTVRTLADQNLLFFAVSENRFKDVSALMKKTGVKLTAADWATKDDKGISLLEHASGTDALKAVFQKHCWKSAADLQSVWNAVPPAEKKQLECGKPPFSFRRFKSDFMHSAVLTAVKKSKSGR